MFPVTTLTSKKWFDLELCHILLQKGEIVDRLGHLMATYSLYYVSRQFAQLQL